MSLKQTQEHLEDAAQREFQESLVAHYTEIQGINEQILDEISLNPVTQRMLADRYQQPSVGLRQLDLDLQSSSFEAPLVAGCITFGVLGLIGGLFLAVPATALIAAGTVSYVNNTIEVVINNNQAAIVNAARFVTQNITHLNRYPSDVIFKIADQRSLSQKEFAEGFISISRILGEIFSTLPEVIPTKEEADLAEEARESVEEAQAEVKTTVTEVETDTDEASEAESEPQEPSDLDFSEEASQADAEPSNEDIAEQVEQAASRAASFESKKESLLIISDEILSSTEELQRLCEDKNAVSEMELLATISVYEDFVDVATDEAEVERVSTIVLPKLREALALQQA